MTDQRPRPGQSTRAIRADSRISNVRQVPTSVPIHQTATFASADAEELAAILAGDQPVYAHSGVASDAHEVAPAARRAGAAREIAAEA